MDRQCQYAKWKKPKKDKSCSIPLLCGIDIHRDRHKYRWYRYKDIDRYRHRYRLDTYQLKSKLELIDTEDRLVIAWGRRVGKMNENAQKYHFWAFWLRSSVKMLKRYKLLLFKEVNLHRIVEIHIKFMPYNSFTRL